MSTSTGKAAMARNVARQQADCAICLQRIIRNVTQFNLTKSGSTPYCSGGHMFHNNCILQHAKARGKCPTCRGNMSQMFANRVARAERLANTHGLGPFGPGSLQQQMGLMSGRFLMPAIPDQVRRQLANKRNRNTRRERTAAAANARAASSAHPRSRSPSSQRKSKSRSRSSSPSSKRPRSR